MNCKCTCNCCKCSSRRVGLSDLKEHHIPGEILLIMPPGKTKNDDIEKQLERLDIDPDSINSDNIKQCPCDPRIVVISGLLNREGDLVGDPPNRTGGGSSGNSDLNYYSYFTKIEHASSKTIIDRCEEDSIENPFCDENIEATKVAILDSPVDENIIRFYANEHGLDLSRVRIKNEDCTNSDNVNTDHGTTVAIRLIERFLEHCDQNYLDITVYNILDKKELGSKVTPVITQFKVICALVKAIEDGNTYINMSFSFAGELPLVEQILRSTFMTGSVIAVSCAAGNDYVDISQGSSRHNYPSSYARDGLDNVYEVVGSMKTGNDLKLWRYDYNIGQEKGSNYISSRAGTTIYSSDAVIVDNDPSIAGTSFAAPRVLADLINGLDGTTVQLDLPNGGTMECEHVG